VQVLAKAELEDPLENQEEVLVHLIHVQERLNPPWFEPWSFDNKAAILYQFRPDLLCDVSICFVKS